MGKEHPSPSPVQLFNPHTPTQPNPHPTPSCPTLPWSCSLRHLRLLYLLQTLVLFTCGTCGTQ